MSVICTQCGGQSGVVDSRPISSTVRRRRKCDKCGHKWTTFEFGRESIAGMRAAVKLLSTIDEHRATLKQLAAVILSVKDISEIDQ